MQTPNRVLRTIIGILVIVLLATVIIGLVVGWPGWINWSNDSTVQWPSHFIGLIVGLIITLIVISIIIRVMFGVMNGPMRYHHHRRWDWDEPWSGNAEEILDMRYARGEITKEQYVQMKDDLRKDRMGPGPNDRPK